MNSTTSQLNTASIAAPVATLAARIGEQQAALRQALTARRSAEVKLEHCKTRTSPAAKQHQAEMDTQQAFAASLRQSISILSREPEAAELAARFGDRRLCKYVAINAAGRDILDILRAREVQIRFFQIAVSAGVTEFATCCHWFDMPGGERVGVEVKS